MVYGRIWLLGLYWNFFPTTTRTRTTTIIWHWPALTLQVKICQIILWLVYALQLLEWPLVTLCFLKYYWTIWANLQRIVDMSPFIPGSNQSKAKNAPGHEICSKGLFSHNPHVPRVGQVQPPGVLKDLPGVLAAAITKYVQLSLDLTNGLSQHSFVP